MNLTKTWLSVRFVSWNAVIVIEPGWNAAVVNEYVRCYVTRQDGVEGAVRQAASSPKLK